MTRTLIFMGLIAMSILISSCDFLPICSMGRVIPLDQTIRKKLNLVKKEANRAIILTTEKVKRNEMDSQLSNAIIDTLTKTINQMDTLIATSYQVAKIGLKERILQFAYRTEQVTTSMLISLKSLRDLYDISTNSQFETSSFFPADALAISPEKIGDATKAIEPVVQRMVRFFADHPRQKFKAMIIFSVTSDGQKQNVKLNEGRARSVANLLVDLLKSNKEFIPHMELINWNFKWTGQREVLPEDVKSRGTVSILWSLVPAELYAGAFEN